MTRRPSTRFDRIVNAALPRIYALADAIARPRTIFGLVAVVAVCAAAAVVIVGGVTP